MTITSWSFIAFLVIAILALTITPGRWRANFTFPLTGLIFIYLVIPHIEGIYALLGYVGLVWLATEVTFRWPKRHIQVLTLSAILLVFGWMKAYEFLAFLPFSRQVPATIGLSYVLIRSLQVLIDVAETPSIRPSLLQLFGFLTSWPCLVSGPIQRYQDFLEQMALIESFRLQEALFFTAAYRIAKGFFFVLVLADFTKFLWTGLEGLAFNHVSPIALAGAQVAFLIHLFFDFSGYTEIVIGAGYLIGLQLPENFNHPWQSKSFLEYWTRWHMTMSNFLKTYLFNSLLKTLVTRWPNQRLSNYHVIASFFVTFFLIGLWHGTTWAFVIMGLLFGAGASLNQLYRIEMRNWLGKKRFNNLSINKYYVLICACLTFAFICFSVSPLWLSYDQILQILKDYGFSGMVVAESSLIFMVLPVILVVRSRFATIPKSDRHWWIPFQIGFLCAVMDAYTFLFPAFGGAFFYERF